MYDFRITIEPKILSSTQIIDCLKGMCKAFVFQLEEGEKTHKLHYQGRCSLIKKKRPHLGKKQFKETFEKYLDGVSWYFNPTTNAEYTKGSFNYVMKDDTRIDGPWCDNDIPRYVPRHIRGIDPYPFQQQVLDSMHVYDDRHVNCIIDPTGNNGKSVLSALIRNRGGITIPVCGDSERLIATVCDILLAKQTHQPKLVAIDLPRAINNKRLNMMMTAIEVVKDGWVVDTRNRLREWEYDKPQIWVFTNNDIPTHYMSADRWIFWNINENRELVRVAEEPEL